MTTNTQDALRVALEALRHIEGAAMEIGVERSAIAKGARSALDQIAALSAAPAGQSITCQIYGHVVGHCAECNVGAEVPASEQQPAMTDEFRAALLWLLWHHQGGSSPVGQPIRSLLNIGQHAHMTEQQVEEAKRFRALLAQQAADSGAATLPSEQIFKLASLYFKWDTGSWRDATQGEIGMPALLSYTQNAIAAAIAAQSQPAEKGGVK